MQLRPRRVHFLQMHQSDSWQSLPDYPETHILDRGHFLHQTSLVSRPLWLLSDSYLFESSYGLVNGRINGTRRETKMKKFLITLSAMVAFTGSAMAADMAPRYTKAPPPV